MELSYGAEVKDLDGNVIGKVDHLVRDTWTGGIRKFVVRNSVLQKDLFFSPEDVSQATASVIILKTRIEELKKDNTY